MNPTTTNLWHGYSLDTIDQLARTATLRAYGRHVLDPDDAYETAWGAIVEHLATTTQPPTPRRVLAIASCAINTAANQSHSHHGIPHGWGGNDNSATPNFARYWQLLSHGARSPEDTVVDRRALAQIWPMLTPQQQQTLWALALHDGDHRAAARELGCSLGAFRMRLCDARAEYRGWWHQGERPSGMWGQSGKHGRRTAAQVLALRRWQRARRAAANPPAA